LRRLRRIELILPGGTLIAVLLWLYRRHRVADKLPPSVTRWMSKARAYVRRLTEGRMIEVRECCGAC
jgi:hypothetical protein